MFGSILVVVFNVILVALKVLVIFEIFKEISNKFAVKFQMITTVRPKSMKITIPTLGLLMIFMKST